MFRSFTQVIEAMLCLLGLVQRSRCGFDALCCEPHRFEFGQHLDASEVVRPALLLIDTPQSLSHPLPSTRHSYSDPTGNPRPFYEAKLGEVHNDGFTNLFGVSRELPFVSN